MTAPEDSRLLSFFSTPVHRCSYLAGRDAVTVFADPRFPKSTELYSVLSRYGFRRSGTHIYRPQCPGCSACIPVRIPVREFVPRRRQRRVRNRNADLTVIERPAEFREEHFDLYRGYLAARHPGGGMDNPTPQQYTDFLIGDWCHTVFYEFRQHRRLLAVAVADRLDDGLSAVYTFFDPTTARRSLGTHAVLWEIEECWRLGLDWLYLGYWIPGCGKMSYKQDFQPSEYFVDGSWTRHAPAG